MIRTSSGEIRRYVAGCLERHRGAFNRALAKAGAGPMGRVLPFYTRNIPFDAMPCLLVEQTSESAEWVALPAVVKRTFVLSIWGMAAGTDEEALDDAVAALADEVQQALMAAHRNPLEGYPYEIAFDGTVPVRSIRYGGGASANTAVRGFEATFECAVVVDHA